MHNLNYDFLIYDTVIGSPSAYLHAQCHIPKDHNLRIFAVMSTSGLTVHYEFAVIQAVLF